MADFNLNSNRINNNLFLIQKKQNLVLPKESKIDIKADKPDAFVSKAVTTKANNGKFDLDEGVKNFAKGLVSPVTAMFASPQNFMAGIGSIAVGAVATIATGGAILPVFVAFGVGAGLVQGGKAAFAISQAKNGDDVEKALFDAGTASFTLASSVLGAKSALKGANIETNGLNPISATIKCIKETPSLVVKSFNYIKDGSALAAFTSIIKGKSAVKEIDNQAKLEEKKVLEKQLESLKKEIGESEKIQSGISKKLEELQIVETQLTERNKKLQALDIIEKKAIKSQESLNKKIIELEQQKNKIEFEAKNNAQINGHKKTEMEAELNKIQANLDEKSSQLLEIQQKSSKVSENKSALESAVESLEKKKAGLEVEVVKLQSDYNAKKLEFNKFEQQAVIKKNELSSDIAKLEQKRSENLANKSLSESEIKKLDVQLEAKKEALKNINEQISLREKTLKEQENKLNIEAKKEAVLKATEELQAKVSTQSHSAVGKQVEIALDKDGEFIIGREASDKSIGISSDPTVSGKHLKINRTGESVVITDLSSNGTIVNGFKIDKGVGVPLKIADEVQIGNAIYIFDGSKLKTLTNDAATYREFFGLGVNNISFSQGQEVGDCYLLAGFDSLRENINARTYLANMISKSANGDIKVKFAGAGQDITFAASEVNSVLQTKGIVGSVKGVQLLERAYGRLIKPQRQLNDPTNHKTVVLMSGGRPNDAMEAIIPAKKTIVSWAADLGDSGKEAEIIPMAEKYLSYFSGNKEKSSLVACTRRNPSNAAEGHNLIFTEIDGVRIAQTHAYSVKDVDMVNKTVTVSNPWDSNSRAVVGFNDFFKYFGTIDRVFI